MTQEDKELLLKDLCARLQHNVQILADIDKTFEGGVISTLKVINLKKDWVELQSVLTPFKFDEIRPYLRPMSSMTEEEKEELLISILGNKEDTKYFQVMSDGSIDQTDNAVQELSNFTFHWINFDGINTSSYIDWLNANHFDYRNLIGRGLALEAPEKMYKTE